MGLTILKVEHKKYKTMNTIVKKQFSSPAYLNNLFNEFNVPAYTGNVPAINVIENKEGFRIEVAAPGLEKSDFKLNLENNQLTISAQKQDSKEEETSKYSRREFKYNSFQRTFTIPNTVNGAQIAASYDAGILNVSLPKREEAKEKPAREIEIA